MVCFSKYKGGLEIHDLEDKNTTLLGKWLFKLLIKEGIWKTLLKRKYIGSKALSHIYWKPGGPHFWAGFMAMKKHFFGSFSIKNGSEIWFWEDKWIGNTTLHKQYLALYAIVRHKGDTIAHILGIQPTKRILYFDE
jgi:hypothetical protein